MQVQDAKHYDMCGSCEALTASVRPDLLATVFDTRMGHAHDATICSDRVQTNFCLLKVGMVARHAYIALKIDHLGSTLDLDVLIGGVAASDVPAERWVDHDHRHKRRRLLAPNELDLVDGNTVGVGDQRADHNLADD